MRFKLVGAVRRYVGLLTLALIYNLCMAQTMPATDLPPELNPWLRAILKTESNNQPWAILNNTYFRKGQKAGGFFPTRQAAEDYAGTHIAMGHDLDLGKYQLNWKYQKSRPGVTLANIFDPYVQEQVAKAVLKEFYLKAKKTYGAGELAERRAVSAYNNGNIFADNIAYLTKINKVLGKSNASLVGSDSGLSGTAAGQGSGIGAPGAEDTPSDSSEDSENSDNSDTKKEDGSAIGTVFGVVFSIIGAALLIFFAPKLLILLLKGSLKKGLQFAAKKAAQGAANAGHKSTDEAKSLIDI